MNMRIVQEITDFIFVEDELEKADVIFIPGGSYPELPERAAELWKEGYAPFVVPSGRFSITRGKFPGVKSQGDKFESPFQTIDWMSAEAGRRYKYQKEYDTECEFYTDVLLAGGVAADNIFQEAEAQYTAQNARLSRKLLDEKGIQPKKAILCCKGYHARRCLQYYQFSFPDTEFMVAPVFIDVTRENWYRTERGREKVLGELTRLGTQFVPEWEAFGEHSN